LNRHIVFLYLTIIFYISNKKNFYTIQQDAIRNIWGRVGNSSGSRALVRDYSIGNGWEGVFENQGFYSGGHHDLSASSGTKGSINFVLSKIGYPVGNGIRSKNMNVLKTIKWS